MTNVRRIPSIRAEGHILRGANTPGVGVDGLAAYWKMDVATGPLVDYSGNGHDGDFYGSGHALAPGKFGNALSLDGNGHARGGSWIPANMGATDLSYSCWFKVGTLSGLCYMVVYYTGAGGGSYIGIGFNSTRQVRGVAVAGGASQCVIDGPAQAHDDDEWHHAVLTRDYTNEWAFYIDGALIDTSNDPGGDASASATLNFGNLLSTTASGRFPGTLDEISIWDRALPAEEVAALYGMAAELPVGNSGALELDDLSDWPAAVTADDVATLADAVDDIDFTVQTGAANVVTVVVKWEIAGGTTGANDRVAHVWLSESAGGEPGGFLPSSVSLETAGAELQEIVANQHWLVLTKTGGVGLLATDGTKPPFYANAVNPSTGKIHSQLVEAGDYGA